ncbi:hypothetical protein MS3_00004908 [Schistosoma haematobium]|uniref:Uncharacterized protein n=2 Tax=Schistosoma TaxID=6181 RepID=A0A095CBK9_SCHHA|nr:hypothetical protein MS3_00004908 [Schistosoma haematobium]KAH9587001.1 hypothetical protein MS3_00004908 [Schistosoma haematobium]CAH8538145.1 unnamed protein product [Schistosoma haematobium]CAH8542026.1 unnamed protein product [Schistosoma haematobium]
MSIRTPYERLRTFCSQLAKYIPEIQLQPPHTIKNYGNCPYFYKFHLGTKDLVEKFNDDILPSSNNTYRLSNVPRESIGTHSDEMKLQDFQWLMNKKLTCVLLWLGVIILIVGVIALQIASFFLHKRQDILSIGVGCLSSGLCLLSVTLFTFLHAHVFIYEIPDDNIDEHQYVVTRRKEDQTFNTEDEFEYRITEKVIMDHSS